MIVKTVRAPTTREALARVKAAFGPSALIIETRTVRPGGLLGFFRKPMVEVVVGIEEEESRRAPSSVRPGTQRLAWEDELANIQDLERQIASIHQSLRRAAADRDPQGAAPTDSLVRLLVDQGLSPRQAADLVAEARAAGSDTSDPHALSRLRQLLAGRFRAAAEPPEGEVEGTRVLAAVGPGGGGKTTLVAKLAGRFALERRERVALASLDFFRVGAVEQLKAYAEILDVPFHHLGSPDDVAAALEATRPAQWLLVDTPGLACRDSVRIERLAAWLRAFPAVERHLVLDATTETKATLDAIARYRVAGIDRLAFTRLDEARRPGVMLSAAEAAAVPVSYLATGQDVAADLEVARPDRIAELILGPNPGTVARLAQATRRSKRREEGP
ncbi:MAG: flagellar biosynthesis protein FlhF [Candidatus Brocadiia bacterium]